MQDLRYAFRMLRKRPGFAAVAISALGLGIGANSAVFSVTNAILLRPFPFPRIDRLVEVRSIDPRRPGVALPMAPADFLDVRDRAQSFEHLAAYAFHDYDLAAASGDPESVRGFQVTADFLATLRARPAVGRDFRPDENEPGHEQVALIGDGLWRSRFGADPGILGKMLLLDGRPFTIVGVMPRGFEFPMPEAALWTPLAIGPAQRSERRNQSWLTAARLRDGVTLDRARAELAALAARLERAYPDTNENRGAGAVLLRERQGEFSKPFLALLQATALFVLLIACANLANLQLANGIARRREIAVRASLGAGRWRVVRLLLAESLLLSAAAGAAGIALAYGGVRLVKLTVNPATSRLIMGWDQVGVQPAVLAFTLAVALGAGIAFGLSTALQASRVDLAAAIKDGGQQGGTRSRLRPLLVVAETTLAVVALIGASQAVRGFQNIFAVYQGYSPNRVLTTRMILPAGRYPTPVSTTAFFDRLLSATADVPDVESATVSSNLPGALNFNPAAEVEVEGRATEAPVADYQAIGPGYFNTLGIALAGGRAIGPQDGDATTPVAVVSTRLAARCWPGESALGKRIRLRGTGDPWRTVVGVASEVHQFWFQKEPRLLVYVPYRQQTRRALYLAVRTRGNPVEALTGVRQTVRRLDAALPLHDPKPMPELIQETMSGLRLTSGMMFVFGVLGLVLAGIGVYGVMAYSVTQRQREFGIRMALGAAPGAVLRAVVRQGLALTAWGLALGLAGGLALSRAMAGIMFGVSAGNWAILAGAPALLAAVALAACWVPARGISKVDPVSVLRGE